MNNCSYVKATSSVLSDLPYFLLRPCIQHLHKVAQRHTIFGCSIANPIHEIAKTSMLHLYHTQQMFLFASDPHVIGSEVPE
jgi:hypothetical protein